MKLQTNVSLKKYTTFQIGGPAEYFAVARSAADLTELLVHAEREKLPVLILGGGSNVLVPDEGLSGLTIHIDMRGISAVEQDGKVQVTVGAGEVWDEFVAHTVFKGWWGLENLTAIPGSVGATPVQNVGAYGVEVSDCISSVTVVHKLTGVHNTLSAQECQFEYRDSIFKHEAGKDLVVVSATFCLSTVPVPRIAYRDLAERFSNSEPTQSAIRNALIEIRGAKFPDWNHMGTAGSFFKNPVITKAHYHTLLEHYPELPGFETPEGVKVPLGWIIDKVLQYRGTRVGNVGCYKGQALVVVNYGDATASEVKAFTERIQTEIKQRLKISIEPEVTYL